MLRPNVVEAKNLVTVREELVGFSQGTPDQVFSLQRRPVERASLKLEVREGDEAAQAWEMVNDFLASGNVASHYTLNSATGEIKFGDGRRGRIPVAGAEIVARTYRYGGGEAGNVPAKAINSPRSALLGVEKVENIRKAVGGRDEQAVDEFLKEAPAMLRCRNRAVSIEDYRMLAEEAGGVGKAKALANYHPDYPGMEVPGAVTVVIVPDNDDRTPKPSPDQLEVVCRYLDERRLLTTELYVKGPEYLPVKVAAKVAVEPYASFAEVKSNIILAIDTALDPLGRKQINPQAGSSSAAGNGVGQSTAGTGEPSGRDFGLDLYPTSLFSVIQNVPNVKAIESLAVNGLEGQELNRPIELKPDMLVYGSTDHEITIVPYEEDGQQ
jgi:predicted phage baseplate assembly protein